MASPADDEVRAIDFPKLGSDPDQAAGGVEEDPEDGPGSADGQTRALDANADEDVVAAASSSGAEEEEEEAGVGEGAEYEEEGVSENEAALEESEEEAASGAAGVGEGAESEEEGPGLSDGTAPAPRCANDDDQHRATAAGALLVLGAAAMMVAIGAAQALFAVEQPRARAPTVPSLEVHGDFFWAHHHRSGTATASPTRRPVTVPLPPLPAPAERPRLGSWKDTLPRAGTSTAIAGGGHSYPHQLPDEPRYILFVIAFVVAVAAIVLYG